MRIQGLLGIIVFLCVAWIISEKRKSVNYTIILAGVLVQFAVAGILLYIPFFKKSFLLLNNVVLTLEAATKTGTAFVFGYIGGGTPQRAARFYRAVQTPGGRP